MKETQSDELLVQYLEDDADAAKMAALYMQQFGIILDVSESIEKAKAAFDPNRYAAVITDLNLPTAKAPNSQNMCILCKQGFQCYF